MKKLKNKLMELYKNSFEFTGIASTHVYVKSDADLIISICPLHTSRAYEADIWTLEELYNFYDNYACHQIDEMWELNEYPLHLTVMYRDGNKDRVITDTDADICMLPFEEVLELIQKRLKRLSISVDN